MGCPEWFTPLRIGVQGSETNLKTLQSDNVEEITFLSYNSTGIENAKCDFIKQLMRENDISFIAIQEHFKTVASTRNFFKDQFNDCHILMEDYRAPQVDCG